VFAAVWEYDVDVDAAAAFEAAYGPGGAWSRLFAANAGYQATVLVADRDRSGRYLVIDLFTDEAAYRRVRHDDAERYQELSAACGSLWRREVCLAPGWDGCGS
jgi:hypothetical protein